MKDLTLDEFLLPINAVNDTGVNLRDDTAINAIYYAVKDARQNARQAETKFLQQESDDNGLLLWDEVKNTAAEVLKTQSKDIEVLVWLIEALLRTESFPGLTFGFQIATNMIEAFWENLYPEADEDGLESKVAAFIGLNGDDAPGSLIQPIKSVSITAGRSVGPFALWHYQQALEIEKITDPQKRDQRIRDIGFSLSDIHLAVKESSADFYEKLLQEVEACQTSFDELDAVLTEKCAHEAPPSSFIRHALMDVKEHIQFLLQDAPFKDAVLAKTVVNELKPEEATITKAKVETINTATPIVSNAMINSRAEALQILSKVANYFSDAEPHSPIPFLLNRAIRWGNMALPDLLKELISEEEAKVNVGKLTGISLVDK